MFFIKQQALLRIVASIAKIPVAVTKLLDLRQIDYLVDTLPIRQGSTYLSVLSSPIGRKASQLSNISHCFIPKPFRRIAILCPSTWNKYFVAGEVKQVF